MWKKEQIERDNKRKEQQEKHESHLEKVQEEKERLDKIKLEKEAKWAAWNKKTQTIKSNEEIKR